MSDFLIKPQTVLVKETEWSMSELKQLKDIYSGRSFIEIDKKELRKSSTLQKALKCEAVTTLTLQKGDVAYLYMSKIGFDLMELV